MCGWTSGTFHRRRTTDKTIDTAVRECSRLLIVLSPASVESREVRGELRLAFDQGKPVLPVLHQSCEIPRQLRLIQLVDFMGPESDHEAALGKVLSALRQRAEKVVPAPPGRGLGRRLSFLRFRPGGAAVGKYVALMLIVLVTLFGAGYLLKTRTHDRRLMNSAALSPNGAYLAAATGQGLGVGTVRIWDVKSGRQLPRLTTKRGPFWVVSWSPKGYRLAIGNHNGKIQTYEAATWKPLTELEGPTNPIHFIAWSPDDTSVATGDDQGTLWAWNANNGKPLFRSPANSKNIAAAEWSTDGRRIATASWDSSVAVVDSANGNLVARLRGHNSFVGTVAWSPDGKWIASGSLEEPYLIVWDAAGRPRNLAGHRGPVERVAWSSDGEYLASSSRDKAVQLWDGRTFGNVGRVSLSGEFISATDLAWSKVPNRLASGDDENVWIFNPLSEPVRKLVGYSKDTYGIINVAGWSLDGARVAAFRTDDGATVWDTATGNVSGRFRASFFEALTE